MTTLDDANPPDHSMDAESKDEPLPKDYWPLVRSGNKIPHQLREDARLIELWDGMLTIASRHPERNLFHAILATANVMCDGIQDVIHQMDVLAPLAKELERLNELDQYLDTKPITITEIQNKLKSTSRRRKERDAILDRLVTNATDLVNARWVKSEDQNDKPQYREITAERNSRYIQRMKELILEGMKVVPASERVYKEELEAGRNPPKDNTIKTIYTQRNKRPPVRKNNFPPA